MQFAVKTLDTPRRRDDYQAWLVNAVSHLRGASAIFDAAQGNNSEYTGREMKLPCLFLAGIGIELTLKANLLRQGTPYAEAKAFSHDLFGLWSDPRSWSLREYVFQCAQIEWEYALRKGQIPAEQRSDFSRKDFVQYLTALSTIYSSDSGYALRYPSDDLSLEAPAPFLLVKSFLWIADSLTKSSTLLDEEMPA